MRETTLLPSPGMFGLLLQLVVAGSCGRTVQAECDDGCSRPECRVDEDCERGELCQGGMCVPRTTTDTTPPPPPPPDCNPPCEPFESCIEGFCVPPECLENIDCGEDFVCLEGACVYAGACVEDIHCPSGLMCIDHECVGTPVPGEPIPCKINGDCPQKAFCIDSECKWGIECIEHAHCPAGEGCFLRLCFPL